jgi:uncharacterized RDD family membrane protein YckC
VEGERQAPGWYPNRDDPANEWYWDGSAWTESRPVAASEDDPALSFPADETRVSGRRLIAHLADGLVYTLIALVFLIPAALISNAIFAVAVVIWLTVGVVAYYVLTQRKNGRTPGKTLMGIRVVDAEGNTPSTGALVRRTLPLLIEYIYVIALIAMMSSPYRQRLGDRWGHTYVIDDT